MRHLLLAATLILSAAPLCARAADDGLERLSPPEAGLAVAAARAGLARFLRLVPAAQTASYGFANRAEIDRARLAAPYRVVTADEKGESLVATEEWRFPIAVDGRYRALLTVAMMDGQLKAVNLGATGLATELAQLEKDRAVAPAARRLLLRLFSLRADFVSFPASTQSLDQAPFTPLASARAQPGSAPDGQSAAKLLPWVHERRRALPPTTR